MSPKPWTIATLGGPMDGKVFRKELERNQVLLEFDCGDVIATYRKGPCDEANCVGTFEFVDSKPKSEEA